MMDEKRMKEMKEKRDGTLSVFYPLCFIVCTFFLIHGGFGFCHPDIDGGGILIVPAIADRKIYFIFFGQTAQHGNFFFQ